MSIFAVLISLPGSLAAQAPCDLLEACHNPSSCPLLSKPPPEVFDTTFTTTAGVFTIRAFTEWAPPYAKRFWQLGLLKYMVGAPFYRVDRINATAGWVAQFGYSGDPVIDTCWEEKMTLNSTWSVQPPGNIQGAVSFSMDAVHPSPKYPNCSSSDYCAQGFSTNIFINYQNNSALLDPPAFSPFGIVLPPGMDVVNALYAGYGEVTELCPEGSASSGSRRPDIFCRGRGERCQGVDMELLLKEGHAYLQREKSKLDAILDVRVEPVAVPTVRNSKVAASRFRLLADEETAQAANEPHDARGASRGAWYPKDEIRL